MLPANLQRQAGPSPLLSFGASHGTGFFVADSGYIMTAKHVVEGCGLVRVAGDGFEGQVAEVLALDPDDDLALLRVAFKAPGVLEIAEGSWGDSEKTVRAAVVKQEFGQGSTIGYPWDSDSPMSQKVQLPPSIQTSDQKHFYRVADGSIEGGDSGSPVLYQNGEVAGVLIRIDPQQQHWTNDKGFLQGKGGLFVAGPVVKAFAMREGVQLPSGDPTGKPTDPIVHVFCFTSLPRL